MNTALFDRLPVTDVPHRDDSVLDMLEDLIEVARDEEEGFRQTAEHASDPGLQNQLMQFRRKRGEFVRELQMLERQFGKENVDDSGSLAGAFHRAWIGLRSALTDMSDKALLEEAERGENGAIDAYQEALEKHTSLPMNVRNCVLSQAGEIRKTRDTLHDMKVSRQCAA